MNRATLAVCATLLAAAAITGAYLAGRHQNGTSVALSHAVATQQVSRAPSTTPSSSAPPAAPVSTTARLTGHCVTGLYYTSSGVFKSFASGAPYLTGSSVTAGYQLTLKNVSTVTAEIGGFAVVFYDGSSELGSDTEGGFDSFITQGQSLTWTEQTAALNTGSTGAVDAAATCQLVKWQAP